MVGVNNIPFNLIFNMDQTSVKLQNTYKKTLSPIGAKQVTVIQPPAEKECMTVALMIGADGSKFPAAILFKGALKTGVLSPKILQKLVIPDNVRVYSNAKGWWNAVFDRKWLKDYLNKNHRGGCLIRDQATVHCNVASRFILEKLDIEQVFIPKGLTGMYQPLDVGVNFPFKCYLKKSYHQWRDERTKTTKKGYLKKPDRQDFINFVSDAWEKISVLTVQNAFAGAKITPGPQYMLASQDKDSSESDVEKENLDSSFEWSFNSVEESFSEE